MEEKPEIQSFPAEILERLAEIIADTRSGSEITRFFRSAGYSEFVHDGSTKKWFVLNCFDQLNKRSDGPYHVIKVIEKLSDPMQYFGKPDVHKNVVTGLNQALVFHKLKVNSENKVVVFKQAPPTIPVADPASKGEIALFKQLRLHPKVKEVSEKLFIDGHYAQAIFEAFKAVNSAVKYKSGIKDKDGRGLMAEVFSGNPPCLALSVLKSQSEQDEQEGFKFLFMGAMVGIRNPKAHDNIKQADPYRAIHYLTFASLLMMRVDDAIKTGP